MNMFHQNLLQFLLVGLVFSASTLPAQVQQAWLERYNGPSNGWDSAVSVATDASGNVYIAGVSESSANNLDYLTTKYQPDGTFLWASRYNGTGNGSDVPAAVKVDTNGNVYVTGTSRSQTNGDDIVTVKYDSNGTQLWLASYTSVGAKTDSAVGLAIGSAGDIYVAGSSSNNARFVAIKYDASGAEVWKAFYNGTNGSINTATSLALDSADNVYVTGSAMTAYYFSYYATVKFNTNGASKWVAYYPEQGGLNYPVSAFVDLIGNVYVTGRSEETDRSSRYDYATVKYSPDGVQLWFARYGSPFGLHNDMARALVGDAVGNVFVTGSSSGVSADDIVTVKYSPTGVQEWLARYNGSANGADAPSGMALDMSGNAYVVGSSVGFGATNLTTLKYASNGNQLWATNFAATVPTNLASQLLVLGPSNQLYVCGEIAGLSASRDIGLVRYDQFTNSDYPLIIGQPTNLTVIRGSNATFTVNAVAAAPLQFEWNFNGQTQTVATTQNLLLTNVQPAQQGFYSVRVFNDSGSVQSPSVYLTVNYISNQPQSQIIAQGANAFWNVVPFGTPPFTYQWRFNGTAIPLATNNIYFVTNVQPLNAGWYSVVVSNLAGVMPSDDARLSVDTRVRQMWADTRDPGHSLALDLAGNIYVTGSTGDCITVEFAPDGSRRWRSVYASPYNGFDGMNTLWFFRARLITVDAAGNSYIAATSKGVMSGDSDYVTIKYDTNGVPLWIARLDGNPTNSTAWPVGIALDSAGNVYVTGATGSYPSQGYLTVKYDNNGNQLWVTNRFYAGPAAHELIVSGNGEAWVTGRNGRTVKYDPAGNEIWYVNFGDLCSAMAFDSQTNVIIVGQSYLSGKDYDYITMKYTSSGAFLWSQRYPDSGLSWESAWDVALDTNDNIYVVGNVGLVKYSAAGVRLWFSDSGGRNLKVDNRGAAYVLDAVGSAVTGSDYWLRKVDSNGIRLWEARYTTLSNDTPAALVVDNNGNIYVTGSAGTVRYSEFPAPSLRINVVANFPGDPMQFLLTGEAGRFYSIQASTDLVTWSTITNLVNPIGTLLFSDPAAPNFAQRFYRVVMDF